MERGMGKWLRSVWDQGSEVGILLHEREEQYHGNVGFGKPLRFGDEDFCGWGMLGGLFCGDWITVDWRGSTETEQINLGVG